MCGESREAWIYVGWGPVWNFHSHFWFGKSCFPLLLVPLLNNFHSEWELNKEFDLTFLFNVLEMLISNANSTSICYDDHFPSVDGNKHAWFKHLRSEKPVKISVKPKAHCDKIPGVTNFQQGSRLIASLSCCIDAVIHAKNWIKRIKCMNCAVFAHWLD